jgi:GNAT superfamily N-acetyltransferase
MIWAMRAAGYRITEHDAAQFTEAEVATGNAFFNAIEAELWPEDPPTPHGAAIAAHHALPARLRRKEYRAWTSEGELVGSVAIDIDPDHDDDPDVVRFLILVARDYRRHAVGGCLLERVVALAHAEGRHRLVSKTYAPVPAGADFATAIGATAVSASHTNHLLVEDVDRPMMDAWVKQGPVRAPGYKLLVWDGAIPEEHLESFVELMLVMNDAPRDELAVNDFTLTAAEWRETEERTAALGYERWTLVARRRRDGALAGLHDLVWVPELPFAVHIGNTGVRPEHRGQAIGKWLKAAMTLRVLDERPGVVEIRTDNADSNDAMLGINREMGYQPLLGATTWEVAVDQAAAWLRTRVG